MKKITALFPMLFVLIIAQAQTKNFIDKPYIDITGFADSMVVPDEIYIRIVVSEKDTKDKISVEEYESRMIDSFKIMGINIETDLTTTDIGSNYQHYLLKKKDIVKTKNYILKVNNAVMATKVFILLEDLEITNVSINSVSYSDEVTVKNITRIKAAENAKQKAAILTKTLNQNVGALLYISEAEAIQPVNLNGRIQGLIIRGANTKAGGYDKKLPPKIEFEKIKISTTVSAKFEIK